MGNLGSGNMDNQVEAEDTHCGDTCDACAATRADYSENNANAGDRNRQG